MAPMKNKANKIPVFWIFGLLAGIFLTAAQPALASEEVQFEDVFINGYKLGWFEQIYVESVLGQDLNDGKYWLDVDSGNWGPVDSDVQHHVDLSEEHEKYVRENLKQPSQETQVEVTSNSLEDCRNDEGCLHW